MKPARARIKGEFAWCPIWPKHLRMGSRFVIGCIRHRPSHCRSELARAHGKTWKQLVAEGFRVRRVAIYFADRPVRVTALVTRLLHGLPVSDATIRKYWFDSVDHYRGLAHRQKRRRDKS